MLEFASQNLVHLAAIFTLVCFLFRDQIKLRAFAAAGDALLSVYYYVAFDVPLWNPMVWSILNVVINVAMIGLILREGRVFQMNEREMNLFQVLDGLSPGQFRTLAKKGNWHTALGSTVITTEGEKPEKLFYILEGGVEIEKAGRSFPVEPKLFIGELAFLRKKPATATVRLSEGSLYMAWSADDLDQLFEKNADIRSAMNQIISRDMAEKVARI